MRIKNRGALVTVAVMSLFLAFLASTMAHAQTGQRFLLTHHVREAVLNGQAPFVRPLPGTQRISLAIMLPLRNQAELDDLLQELYDPYSSFYRQYLTVQEFTERFGPARDDYNAVVRFAEASGMTVTNTASNRLVLDVAAPVASIEKAFHVIMGVYRHPTENRTFYAPDREPSVDLNVPLWHISGLDNYSIPRPLYRKAAAGSLAHGNTTTGSGPDGSFLGSDRRAAYYGGTALTGNGQSVGLVEFNGYQISDVDLYFTSLGLTVPNVPIDNVPLDGVACCKNHSDTEEVIDIVEAISMAPGLSQVRVYIGNFDSDILNAMAADSSIVKQMSCSWSWLADPTSDTPIFQEFAAQGQTFFVASGDNGSWPSKQGFYYPEEDAWVTAVGGTDLTTNGPGGSWESEKAWVGSGGGISQDKIPIPSYQRIAGVIDSSNKGSKKLRNVPDVAAEADTNNYYCDDGTCHNRLGGTSLAAPTWAGFMALVNQNNAANGESDEGFLNPIIYPIGVGANYQNYFHDITVGDNFNKTNPSLYKAVTGYDLVTGWGSPLASGWLGGTGGTGSTGSN